MASSNGTDVDENLIIDIIVPGAFILIIIILIVVMFGCWRYFGRVSKIHIYMSVLIFKTKFYTF